MLTRIEVRNSRGGLLNLPFDDISDGIVLEDITGLGPVKATLVSSSFANIDGEQYHDSRREARDIAIKLALQDAYNSVSDIRRSLYDFFMSKSSVSIRFFDSSGLTVDIRGRVETCEPVLFTDTPTMEVSIRCFSSDFVDPNIVMLTGNTTPTQTERVIQYAGTVETSTIFTIKPNRNIGGFTIYNRSPEGVLKTTEFVAPLLNGDTLTINSTPKLKEVMLLRANTTSSFLYGMSPQSSWINLEPGTNSLVFYVDGAAIPYTLSYNNKYGGL